MRDWIDLDKRHVWHPFTPQSDWCAPENKPVVIVRGKGVWLWDEEGNRYFDGNSSIWTNIHGHGHPAIVEAIARQAESLDHSSFLGFTHPGAIELAERLCGFFPPATLERVFFSDNGSTAIEAALKMAVQFRLQTGEPNRTGFVAFADGYHGDTLGAASLGGVNRFFARFRGNGYPVTLVRDFAGLDDIDPANISAVMIEPLVQGVNHMRPWPPGMLAQLRTWCDRTGTHLIFDEVMTGFGRTGKMFACHHENVMPDFLCLAKGITGGVLPLAATLTTADVYHAFLGPAENAFYYGHSYTANPIACAAALASLDIFRDEKVIENLPQKIAHFTAGLGRIQERQPDAISAVRQCGMIAGIDTQPGRGAAICRAALRHGLLTRPILDTIVLMPPLCSTNDEIDHALNALDAAFSDDSGH